MRSLLQRCLTAMVLLASFGVGPLAQELCMITVHPGQSIQEAVDAAPTGAVICLEPGEWRENLVIGKSLTLRGREAAMTTIHGRWTGVPVMLVCSPEEDEQDVSVILAGLTVSGGTGWGGYGIGIEGRAQCLLQECAIFGNGGGITVQDSAQAEVLSCTISENAGSGIWVWGSAQVKIVSCTVRDNDGAGILLGTVMETGDGVYAEIVQCTVSENTGTGIYLFDSAQVSVVDCDVSKNEGSGIWLTEMSQGDITRCNVAENKRTGIYLWGSSQATITETTISRNGYEGIGLWFTSQASITHCLVVGNGEKGIDLWGSAEAAISESTISENEETGILISGSAHASIADCSIYGNRWDGIQLRAAATAAIEANRIFGNGRYGVRLVDRLCFFPDSSFHGFIAGLGNVIPEPGETDGNRWGNVCPSPDLHFLKSEEGGELDWREEE